MKELDRRARNTAIAGELHPWMRERYWATVHALEMLGERPRGQVGWRSIEQQAIEVAENQSQVLFGYHNVTGPHGKKESFAVDILDDNDPLDRDPAMPHSVYALKLAACAEAAGLKSLIRWGLDTAQRAAVDRAILERNWTAKVQIGKDPDHIQPALDWLGRLQTGWRPPLESQAPTVAASGRVAPGAVSSLAAPSEPAATMADALQVTTFPEPTQTVNWEGAHVYSDLGQLRQYGYIFGKDLPASPAPLSVRNKWRALYAACCADGMRQWVRETAERFRDHPKYPSPSDPSLMRAWWRSRGFGDPAREAGERLDWFLFDVMGGQ